MNIQEDYCDLETAKLLKEKGFDEYCPLWYNLDKPTEGPFFYKEIGWYGHNSYDYSGKRIISAPTLQMAMKWLREVHNIVIVIEPYVYDYVNEKNKSYSCSLWIGDNYYEYLEARYYPSYEDAVKAALKYVLEKLI